MNHLVNIIIIIIITIVTITTNRNENYYKSSDKYVLESSFHNNGDDRYFDKDNCEVTRDDYFKLDEIERIVKSLPNGKSGGADGVTYEDLKEMFDIQGNVLIDIYNVMLVNLRLSRHWKNSLIQRIPRKNYDENDLITLRDISLLPVCYKVLSKAICQRILP